MALEQFTNRATTVVLSGGTDAPSSGTQETWTVSSSSSFGAASSSTTPPTQFHVADSAAPTEVIAVTVVSGTTWTVVRGAESTTPVTHSSGFSVYQVASAGGLGSFPQWFNVRSILYGATGNGTTDDTAAIQAALTAAINAGAGTVYLPPGTYKTSSTITGNLDGSAVAVWADPGAVIEYYGSGDCLRIYDSSTYSSRSYAATSGVFGFLVIDGTHSSSSVASAGLHIGDIFQLGLNLTVRNFKNYAGSIGVHLDNNYYWTEQCYGRVYAQGCLTHVQFDNSANTSGSATGSFDRAVLDLFTDQQGAGNGVTFAGGAFAGNARLGIYGNYSTSTTQYSVLLLTGSNGAGHSRIYDSTLNIGAELDDTAHTAPYTISFAASSNTILNCTGMLDFSLYEPFTASNSSLSNFLYTGLVLGDTALRPVISGPLPAYSQTLSSAATISTEYLPVNYVTANSYYSNIILAAGQYDGQQVTLVNLGPNTFTFASVGSNVYGGSSILMNVGTAQQFVWSAAGSVWYSAGPNFSSATIDTIYMYGGNGLPATVEASGYGNLEYESNDGNTYLTGQYLVQTSSATNGTTGTSSQNVTGLVTPSLQASGQYYLEITMAWEPTGTVGSHTTWGLSAGSGLALSAISMASLIVTSGTTAEGGTSALVTSTTLSSSMWTGPTVAATAGYGLCRLWGTVTVSTAGTLQVVFANATSADTVTVGAGATILLRPLN